MKKIENDMRRDFQALGAMVRVDLAYILVSLQAIQARIDRIESALPVSPETAASRGRV